MPKPSRVRLFSYTHTHLLAQRKEVRERGRHVSAVVNTYWSGRTQRRHAKGHRNTVIAVTMNLTATDSAAINDDAIWCRLALHTQRQQTIRELALIPLQDLFSGGQNWTPVAMLDGALFD